MIPPVAANFFQNSRLKILSTSKQERSIYAAKGTGVGPERTMKARNDNSDQITNVHAEVYHRQKIDAAREEGERLRRELLLRGIDPSSVLMQAGVPRERFDFNSNDPGNC